MNKISKEEYFDFHVNSIESDLKTNNILHNASDIMEKAVDSQIKCKTSESEEYLKQIQSKLNSLYISYLKDNNLPGGNEKGVFEPNYKSTESILDKLYRINCLNNSNYPVELDKGWVKTNNLIKKIDDLLRTTVTLYYRDSVDRFSEILQNEFNIPNEQIKHHSKRERGLHAIHIYLPIPPHNILFEIQVYTATQMPWRKLQHTLYEKDRIRQKTLIQQILDDFSVSQGNLISVVDEVNDKLYKWLMFYEDNFKNPDDTILPLMSIVPSLGYSDKHMYYVGVLPTELICRDNDIETIKSKILTKDRKKTAIIGKGLALHGMGGIGKTVLANMLAHDDDIYKVFSDGIIWITLGQNPNIIAHQKNILIALGKENPYIENEDNGKNQIENYIGKRHILLIVDDVWHFSHIQYFLFGSQCQNLGLLSTTRNAEIANDLSDEPHCVDLLSPEDSLVLLAKWAKCKSNELPAVASEVAKECGYLPLALAMIGAMVRKRPDSWQSALERLKNADLKTIHANFPDYPYPDILKSLQVSVDGLPADLKEKYLSLAVFPEDSPISRKVFYSYWKENNQKTYQIDDILDRLSDYSLLKKEEKGYITLHDLQFDYIRTQVKDIKAAHQHLLDKYRLVLSNGWPSGPNDGYFFQNLITHLIADNRLHDTVSLLTSFEWIETKCEKGLIFDLVEDYKIAVAALPETKAEFQDQLQHQENITRWTKEITEYAQKWSKRRNQLAKGDLVVDPEPILPTVVSSCEIMGEDETDKEFDLLIQASTQHKRLIAFESFIRSQSYVLHQHGKRPGFVIQHAYNTEPSGIVHSVAANLVASSNIPMFLRQWPKTAHSSIRTTLQNTIVGQHNEGIQDMCMTPDGRWAITAAWNNDKNPRVWDLNNGKCVHTLKVETGWTRCVAITPDGRRAVSGGSDGVLRVWDLESGQCIRLLTVHKKEVCCVAITPDCRLAVLHGYGIMIALSVWDIERGEHLCSLKGHKAMVSAVCVTPDGRRAVSASVDKTVQVWDLEQVRCLHTLKGHTKSVLSVSITTDGRCAVSAGLDDTVRLWDIECGKCLRILKGPSAGMHAINITGDTRLAVTGSNENVVRVWNLEHGKCLHELPGHSDAIEGVGITLDGTRAVSASRDKTLRVWDMKSTKSVSNSKYHDSWISCLSLTPDGRLAISGSADKTLRVWDIERGECLRIMKGHRSWLGSVCALVDNRHVASTSWDGSIRLWDLNSGQTMHTLSGHTDGVWCICATHDGQSVISGSEDGTVRIWDLEKCQCIQILEVGCKIWSVSVSPDAYRIVAGTSRNELRVWELESGKDLYTLRSDDALKSNGSVASERDPLGLLNSGKDIQVLEQQDNGPLLRMRHNHGIGVSCVCITPDGHHVVSGHSSGELRIWDLNKGVCIRQMMGHTDGVWSVVTTIDGQYVLSVGEDCTLRLWNINSSQCLGLYSATAPISTVVIGSLNNKICIGTDTGDISFLHIHGVPSLRAGSE